MAFRPPIPPGSGRRAKKRNPLTRIERMDALVKIYEDSREEYYEHNIPTSLSNIFAELLLSIPKDHLESSETLSIFENVLEGIIGKKERKDNTKIYI
jgi:hypothetical protein